MAKKEFDPNQFGGFVPGNVTRDKQVLINLNPAERRAAERAKQAAETPEVAPDTAPEKGKG